MRQITLSLVKSQRSSYSQRFPSQFLIPEASVLSSDTQGTTFDQRSKMAKAVLQCLWPVALADIANQLQLYSIWFTGFGLFLNTRLQAAISINQGWPCSSHYPSLPYSKHHSPPHFHVLTLPFPLAQPFPGPSPNALPLPPFQRATACQGHR